MLCAAIALAAIPLTAADAASTAAKTCKVPSLKKLNIKQATAKLKTAGCGKPKVKKIYSSKVKAGKVITQKPAANKRAKVGGVTITVSLGKKLCVVKKKNAKGKLVTVYQTKLAKVKVRKNGKLVTVKKRVFVYKTVTKTVGGKKKKVKVKVPKMGPCKKKNSTSSGIPVNITIGGPDTVAHLDFGGFQRDVPLSGTAKGFIVGKAFILGQDNQIQLTQLHLDLTPTGIFIDDVCGGEVSDSIRTDPASFVELDEGSTGNQVNVDPTGAVTGLVHLRIQTALDMRNDDDGCNQPYFTTGWTDFTIPLFLRGKLGANKSGLTTTLTTGETVLNDLAACLAPGDPTLVCNGFAIPFPAILTSKIVGTVKIG